MSINRWLLLTVLLIFSAFAILIFGNPQWHWRLYRFQLRGKSYLHGHRYGDVALDVPSNFSGTWTKWNFKGIVRSRCDYVNGQKDGNHIWYFTSPDNNGLQVERTECYKNGVQHGPAESYHSSNKTRDRARYENGHKTGMETRFNEDGSIFDQKEWIANNLSRPIISKYLERSHLKYKYIDNTDVHIYHDQYVYDLSNQLTNIIRNYNSKHTSTAKEDVYIFSKKAGIDRRAEFEIPVE